MDEQVETSSGHPISEFEAKAREILRLLGRNPEGEWMAYREVEIGGMIVAVSDDAYYNLEGALYDLKRLEADKVCIRTIERVQAQVLAVIRALESQVTAP